LTADSAGKTSHPEMELAGIQLSDVLVLELADRLRRAGHDATADRLQAAIATSSAVTALPDEDRAAIIDVLDVPPSGLVSLRNRLLEEAWREGDDSG
jgi:hypothetical protein